MTSVAWSYTLHSDKSGNQNVTLTIHTLVQLCLLSVANTFMRTIGYCPDELEFNVFKPIEQTSRPKLGLAYNFLMMIVAHLTSCEFESTNVQFFPILYSGLFIYRLWSLVFPSLPKPMQCFPLFNLTSTSLLLFGITFCNEV